MNDNGPIYSVLTGKPALFTGFARTTDNRGGSIGILGWPATWSNTSNSFTITNVPNFANDHLFTLSGNTGSITRSGPTPRGSYFSNNWFRSAVNNGGGQLDKDGNYNYDNPTSLNAGDYWVPTPNNTDAYYPGGSTLTYTFANPVLVSASPRPNKTGYAQFTPAAQVSVNGLVTSFTIYDNASAGKVFFTVPAGSARSVTIAFGGGANGWDLTTGGINALRSIVNYNNAGWSLDKFGTYSAPYPYGATKTLTMNPGDYIVDLRQSRFGGGYTGTITIT